MTATDVMDVPVPNMGDLRQGPDHRDPGRHGQRRTQTSELRVGAGQAHQTLLSDTSMTWRCDQSSISCEAAPPLGWPAWHIRAALTAKQLDPTVEPPPRLSVASLERPTHPVGRIAKKRLARLGRRLLLLD